MRAIERKYLQEFADNIEFPTIIYIYETSKIIAYNSLAEEIIGKDVNSVGRIIGSRLIKIEELEKNQCSKIYYNRLYRIRRGFYSEIDVEFNSVILDDKHIIFAFFDFSYKQAFVRHMKNLLPRFFWKDRKRNFLCMNACFINDLECLHSLTFPVRTQDIMDATTGEKLAEDDKYVMSTKAPLMQMLQLIRSDTSEGYFCSINRIPLINSNGSVVGVLGSYRLIFNHNEQKELYDAILRSSNILSQLLSRSDTIVMSWRKSVTYKLEFISSNISVYGYPPEYFYSNEIKLCNIFPSDDYQKILNHIEDIENKKYDYFEEIVTMYKSDGTTVPVKINVVTINKNNGEYLECLLQRAESLKSKPTSVKHRDFEKFHLVIDTWENVKRRELLTKAIGDKCKEFVVYYQPIISVNDEAIIGVEALLRWKSPSLGNVKPLDFLSMSEYLGLINRLGNFSIREALKTYGQIEKNGITNIKIHINISLIQLLQIDFLSQLIGFADSKGVPREQIVLEIKEGLAIEDLDLMKKVILELKEQGFAIALDNFGTGFIDIQYIVDIPFDYIKLDKKFMESYETEKYNGKLVAALLDIIKSMKAEVIVEGIETRKQYEFLLSHEVRAYQGFYYSMPLEKRELFKLLK